MLNVIIAVMWEHKIGFMVSTGRDQGRLPDNGPALLPILLLIGRLSYGADMAKL